MPPKLIHNKCNQIPNRRPPIALLSPQRRRFRPPRSNRGFRVPLVPPRRRDFHYSAPLNPWPRHDIKPETGNPTPTQPRFQGFTFLPSFLPYEWAMQPNSCKLVINSNNINDTTPTNGGKKRKRKFGSHSLQYRLKVLAHDFAHTYIATTTTTKTTSSFTSLPLLLNLKTTTTAHTDSGFIRWSQRHDTYTKNHIIIITAATWTALKP